MEEKPGETPGKGGRSAPDTRLLEQRLSERFLELYQRVGKLTGYWANYFRCDLMAIGGVAIARKLLNSPGASEGFERLKKEGLLRESVEAVVLAPEFRPLFTQAELDRARGRLTEHGYAPSELARDDATVPAALETVLRRVLTATDQAMRWSLRDEVVAFGPAARESMRRWLAAEQVPAFALSVLEKLAQADQIAVLVIDGYVASGGREQRLAASALDRIRRRRPG